MPKKYKHHQLPKKLIGTESIFVPTSGRFIEKLPLIDYGLQKPHITEGFQAVKSNFISKKEKVLLTQDQDLSELKIKFYGQPKKQLIEKYNIEVYEYKRDEKAVIGNISTAKIRGQKQSDFERLEQDIQSYAQDNALKSYFDTLEDIKPLTLDEILETDLKKFFEKSPDQKRIIDISFFSHKKELIEEKYNILLDQYKNNFISKVNTRLVHFCRMKLSFSEIKNVVDHFNEIKDISIAPLYYFEKSSLSPIREDVLITPPDPECNPIFVIDTTCNVNHKVIKNAVVESNSRASVDNFHGTAVTSLIICGAELSPNGDIIQKNKVITIDADLNRLEEVINEVVLQYHNEYPLLIVNLSINDYGNQFYNGSKKNNLTVLIDELSWQYNCLFVISAGNLFTGDTWSEQMGDICLNMGYPDYFTLPFTAILPPADSINGVSVGSVTYQASPRSIAPQEHPSPITRKNIENNLFIKPDLLHYDSNLILNSRNHLESEGNGIFFADSSNNNSLTRGCGTSFATPLVTHEAGIIHRMYPHFNNNSVKGILIHFSNEILADHINNEKIKEQLIGFGKPQLDRALYSLSYSSTVIIEDLIGLNQKKRIKIPIPKSLEGSSRKRMRLRKTLVYNPVVFPQDSNNYNPIKISACIIRPDAIIHEREMENFATRDRHSEAYKKSNVKKYSPIEVRTNNGYLGKFWEVEVRSECKIDELNIPNQYKQNYSLILTVEDINQDESINIHQEISQMIEVQIPIEVNI